MLYRNSLLEQYLDLNQILFGKSRLELLFFYRKYELEPDFLFKVWIERFPKEDPDWEKIFCRKVQMRQDFL